MNSSELRAKIKSILQTELSTCDSLYDDISDRILALLPPPATAKLPEGVEIVETNAHPKFDVRTATQYLGRDGRWRKRREDDDNVGCFGTREEALTAALAAPPVPGESKATPTHDDYHALKFCLAREQDESAALRKVRDFLNARISELEAENERLKAQYDMVEQERTRLMLGQQVPYTPAEKPDARNFVATGEQRQDDYYEKPITEMKPDPLARAVTVGEMLRLAEHYDRCDHGDHALMVRAIFDEHRGGR